MKPREPVERPRLPDERRAGAARRRPRVLHVRVLDATHLRFFTRRSLARLFEECGYEVLRLEGVNASRPLLSAVLAVLTFGHLAESRHLQFACVAAPRKGAPRGRRGGT